jgi:predicted  nucleic acid-binding Zn-ribbon protein
MSYNNEVMQIYQSLGWNIGQNQFVEASEFKSIPEFNEYLINQKICIDLESYIETTNNGHFKCDLSFMKDFMGMVKEKGFVIRHSRLQTTGVISEKSCSTDIKRCLDGNFLVEGIDYLVRLEADQHESGLKHKNIYMLTPRAFKKCLIRSKNTQIYANYYLTLEEAVVYFMEYQSELKSKCVIILKTLGDGFEAVAQKLALDLSEEKIETSKFKTEMKEKEMENERFRENVIEKEIKMRRDIDYLMRKAQEEEKKTEVAKERIRVIIPDRVIQPAVPDNGECLVIIKLVEDGEQKFKVTRCKTKMRNANTKKILVANGGSSVWMCVEHPNAKALFTLMCQQINFITVDKRKATITLRTERTEDDLRTAIQHLENNRLEIINN